MDKRERDYFLINSLILIILVFSLSFLYLNRTNTLHASGRWESSKINVSKGLMGSIAYLTTRVPLVKNQLNLAAWHGYQEIILKKNHSYKKEMIFDFLMPLDRANFVFFFSKKDNLKLGLRLSRRKEIPSAFIVSSSTGEFIEKMELSPILNDQLHSRGKFQLNLNNGKFSFMINDIRFTLPTQLEKYVGTAIVGFRGSVHEAFIDNLLIDPNSDNEFFEDFSHYQYLYPMVLILFFIGFALLYFLRSLKYKITTIHIFITLLSAIYLGIDYNITSKSYPLQNSVDYINYPTHMESLDSIYQRVYNNNAKFLEENKKRILFLGSSQTWGAGVAKDEDIYSNQFCRLLNEKCSQKYGCLNAAVSGWNAELLLHDFNNKWKELKPDIIVIDLSNNDSDLKIFETSLNELVKQTHQMNIKTFFILEANSFEVDYQYISPKHDIMRKIAGHENLEVIDLHQFLLSQYDSGFLWWDEVHMTSYAHSLAAKLLIEKIADQI